MKKNQLTFGVIVFIIVVGLGLTVFRAQVWPAKENSGGPTPTSIVTTAAPIVYQGVEGKTALELLQATHQVETDKSNFVLGIDGIKGNSEFGRYWMFYVNGKLAPVGADQYITNDDESVEWRYEEFK